MYLIGSIIDDFLQLVGLSKIWLLTSNLWLLMMIKFLSLMAILLLIISIVLFFILKFVVRYCVPCGEPDKIHVAFFHPYCNAGGGGERVLWRAIEALHSRYPNVSCYVYTGDVGVEPREILANVRRRFGIELQREPQFIYLNLRNIIEAKHHPVCTLLMQSLSSVFLGAEALAKFRPDVFIDSMGYAFVYPLFRFVAGAKVACYTHYPTISSDMLQRVADRNQAHNNRGVISRSPLLSFIKWIYYRLFALLYGAVVSCAQCVMVNSTWTEGHISSLWFRRGKPFVVFPPCDTDKFSCLQFIPDRRKDVKSIVSIGQFRPEKDYPLQLRSFKLLLESVSDDLASNLKLILIGGVRNSEDEARVESLKALSTELGIDSKVTFKINASFNELLADIQNGSIGLHTMWNEHFGIGVVESMAGGLIMLAHDSGGPKLDIVTEFEGEKTGYLASDEDEYATKMKEILGLPEEDKMKIRENARRSTSRFSEDVFRNAFLNCVQSIIDDNRRD